MVYGACSKCGCNLEPGEWFQEEEYYVKNGIINYTGRVRKSLSYLICPKCGHKEIVDDSFDGPWHF